MAIAREELKKMTLAAASAEEIVEIVKAAGEEITAEEAEHIFKKAQEKKADKELSPDELDAVSGGVNHRDYWGSGCAAGSFYWDDAATEIFRTQGGFMWGQYVKAHYNPRQGLDG